MLRYVKRGRIKKEGRKEIAIICFDKEMMQIEEGDVLVHPTGGLSIDDRCVSSQVQKLMEKGYDKIVGFENIDRDQALEYIKNEYGFISDQYAAVLHIYGEHVNDSTIQ